MVLLDYLTGRLEYKQNRQLCLRKVYLFEVDNNHMLLLSSHQELVDLEYCLLGKRKILKQNQKVKVLMMYHMQKLLV